MDKNFFFNNSDLDVDKAAGLAEDCLAGFDDGEIYLQYSESESISLVDKVIKSSAYDISQGFGMRGVIDDLTGFAHSNVIDLANINHAASVVKSAQKFGKSNNFQISKPGISRRLYPAHNPISDVAYLDQVELLSSVDQYIREKNSFVKQVSASVSTSYKVIQIIKNKDFIVHDIRPMVQFRVMVIVEKNGRNELGFYGIGKRGKAKEIYTFDNFQKAADEALREALVNLESIDCVAGEKTVVLGPGYPGILLHEAVGHGLEGDANRKKTSAFTDMMGKKVAASGVTVIDDGTIGGRRGSLNIDDEGTSTARNILIEDGILVNYMQDQLNARLMKRKPTGNGRRESYDCVPIPRMTNTFMLPGNDNPADIIADVKDGIYAKSFGNGQVDTTSGKFVFNTTECYLIEKGKITSPLKGATLIGNGPDILTKITAIGNDLEFDKGIGTCGKEGQSVPVGVGQPTVRIDKITIGGANLNN